MSEILIWAAVTVFIVIDFVVLISATRRSSQISHRDYIEGEDS